ncbi:hypothetical protein J5W80_05490 [Akkermansia muciniphila]|uniref:hypothetical protein n=1 Tax=Akkermansia muciniphila TaxID=239935 RepID=UPI001C05FDEA|nr:hypothetical protein [Akkermansia muciniphila]QWP30287.1 hypothetical protein J5W80_05490 [Akkermansia muciniphila]
MLIAGTVCFPFYQLLEPFITLWLGAEYILPREIMLLLVIRLFITITRGVVDQFLYGYGLFWDVWAPLAESVINISVAIIGGYLWGLPGVLLGGISSLILIVGIWKPSCCITGDSEKCDELLVPIRLPAGAGFDFGRVHGLDLEIRFPCSLPRLSFPGFMRLPHGRFLWRSDGSFNVLRYAGHARNGAPCAGDGGNPVAVAEKN